MTATFSDAIRAAGFEPPASIEPGRFYRFGTNGHGSDRAGYCKLFPDGEAGIFGDWRSGEQHEWFAERAAPVSHAEAAERKRQADEARKQAEAERQQQYEQAAARAAAIWQELDPAAAHAYSTRKGVSPHGARIDKDGALALPVFSADGALQSLQFIGINGEKRFLFGGKMTGGRFYIGTPADGSPLILCEGWATGASLHEATGMTVACAFSGGNLKHVAGDLRTRFPKSRVIVAGDLDAHGAGGRYAEAAGSAHKAASVALPTFKDGRTAGDFNDLHQAEGLDAVRRQIMMRDGPVLDFSSISHDELERARLTPSAILDRLLYADVRTRIAAGGTGKTTVALYEAIRLAAGLELWGRQPAAPIRTVLVTREDSRELLVARMREIIKAIPMESRHIDQVLRNVRIIDASGINFRLRVQSTGKKAMTVDRAKEAVKGRFAPQQPPKLATVAVLNTKRKSN